MKFKQLLFFLLFFSYLSSFAQKNYTISGYVQENESGENLIGVSIYDKNTFKGTVTNQYGFYSLTLEEGNYEIIYSFIGLQSITKNVNLNKDTRINISLKSDAIITEEVIVTGEKLDKNVSSSKMSQVKIEVSNCLLYTSPSPRD